MSALFEAMTSYLQEENWPYTQQAEQAVLASFGDPQTDEIALLAQVEADQWAIFTCFAPLSVPEAQYLDVLAFLNAANGRVARGGFYLDLEGDSVQFTTSIDGLDAHDNLLDRALLQAQMGRAVRFGYEILQGFYPHLTAVTEGSDAEEAFMAALSEFSDEAEDGAA